MKKGDIGEAVVERIDFPNKGVLNVDGEKVFVKNALPGQKIQFAVHKKRHGKIEGAATAGAGAVCLGRTRKGMPPFWAMRRLPIPIFAI